ncbi:DUF1211 domain-containing membrane protein [Sphingomonas metalli]|uniref:DUF1211 domain-containing membrane protein n=1 Tax=Sphingomonas metalli TaxID=1779358 RepID=A0A916TFI7_9SPHN|nr:TMEM175 family protein [Sphingomonas metalli]GGB42993.1 DUF1211 domain-containing membrane protein [Sphingomonas metalli]
MINDREHAKLERLTFFSDAVFAIAMTLLVIEVRLPELHAATDHSLAQALVDLLPNYIGFIISFLVIGRFWTGHHRLMAMIDAADPALVRANRLLLMAIAFMPFPTAVLSDYSLLRVAIGFYTAYLLVVGLANVRVIKVALRHLSRDDPEATEDARQLRRSMWSPIVIAGAGFAAGMVSPAAGLIAMIVVTPFVLLILTRLGNRGMRPVEAGQG